MRNFYADREKIVGKMAQEVQDVLEPGDRLDHYRIEAEVASGDTLKLYRAVDIRDGTRVALRVLRPEAAPEQAEQMRRAEQIGRELDHVGIAKVYARENRSGCYMAIEWVDGLSLRSILNQQKLLPVERAVKLTIALCDALDYLHKRGVVQRELRPETIMVCAADRIKLIDVGIALKENARRGVKAQVMQASAEYISPEQVQGKCADQRSDIYALGAIFYEMLAGRPPFAGASPSERLLKDPEPVRRLSRQATAQIEEILLRALEREPRNRYATTLEMAWDLEHQEQVGIEENLRKPAFYRRMPRGSRAALYAGSAAGAVALLLLLLALAGR